jgi:signal transduction histidine kinase
VIDRSGAQPLITALRTKTSDNADQQRKVSHLETLVNERFAILDQGVQTRKSAGLPGVLALAKNTRGPAVSREIAILIGDMRSEESLLLAERRRNEQQSAKRAFLIVLIAVFLGMIAVLASVFLAFRDLTRRREVDRLKSEFVSVVSHELRTPLTSIHGSLGLLASGVLGSEKGKRMLEIAVNNTDRLIRLINDILDIEKLESGSAQMQRTVCNAGNLLRHAVDVMRAMAQEHQVTLLLEEHDAAIEADCDRVLQCLTNLLSNAIKFSETGGTVTAKVRVASEQAQFEVADQGRGIPGEKQESIFERFHQVDASDSRRKGGTGLGLAITRSIVLQHGGRIWVESQIGKGSTFFFTIPLAHTDVPVVHQRGFSTDRS